MAKKAVHPIPKGMQTITPRMWFNGNCREAIAFYKKAFDAKMPRGVIEDPNNQRVMHVRLHFGDAQVMMADAVPGNWEQGPTSSSTVGFWLYVEDVDQAFQKAKAAGCKVLMDVEDTFWGDRVGRLKDPFGHIWSLASQRWIYTEEEVAQNEAEWIASIEEEG